MKTGHLLFLMSFTLCASSGEADSGSPMDPLKAGKIPESIRKSLKGRVVGTTSFEDKLGTHSLILTRDSSKLLDGSDKIALQARQYSVSKSKWTLEWTINDNLTCPGLDLDADFILPQLSISDVDSNGIKETTVAYHLACQGGVDPKPTKAIMRQGKVKYAARGQSLVKLDGTTRIGGEFLLDPNMDKVPAFKEYLTTIWKKAAGVIP